MLTVIIQVIQDTTNEFIEALLKQYKAMMFSLAHSILKDEGYVEDANQEALLLLSMNRKKIDNLMSKKAESYIYMVTKNAALSMYRKVHRPDESLGVDMDEILDNTAGVLDIEAFQNKYDYSDEIVEALSQLSETDRDILCFKYGDGYSVKEIAKLIDAKPENVLKQLQRARARLQIALEKQRKGAFDE